MLESSPLLDHAGFTRKLETAMHAAWQHRAAGAMA